MDKKFFHEQIACKTYIKPYIEKIYGTPAFFKPESDYGIMLRGVLHQPIKFHERKEILKHRVFDQFASTLTLKLPVKWKHAYGTTVSDKHVITLNKLFEERFTDDLHRFCILYQLHKKQTKEAIEHFCLAYNIEIDSHVTFEALKKKELRYRKENEQRLSLLGIPGLIILNKKLPDLSLTKNTA